MTDSTEPISPSEQGHMRITTELPLIGYSYLHAGLVALVLVALTVPLAVRAAQRERQPWLVTLVMASLFLHMVGAFMQIVIVRAFYSNSADFHLYDGQGAELAALWRSGTFTLAGLDLDIPGTGMVSLITGGVYTVFGVDQLGGFMVFTWFGLIGLLAFYRAFRLVLPTGDHKRYAAILFLLPSLFYWPSVAGKEAVMMLALGLMTLGAAQLFTARWVGLVPLALGSVIGGLVRPHEVAMVFGAFALGVLTRRSVRRSLLTPVRWVATLVVVGAAGLAFAVVTANFLGISSFSITALVDTLNEQNDVIQLGADESDSNYVWNPSLLYYPVDIYYVLLKPLPFEVTSATQGLAALENLSILGLIIWSWRRLLTVPRRLLDSPFVVMCTVYSVGFIYVFSALGNVGLVARERTLLFPFLFVLLCLPVLRRSDESRYDALAVDATAGPPPYEEAGSRAYRP